MSGHRRVHLQSISSPKALARVCARVVAIEVWVCVSVFL